MGQQPFTFPQPPAGFGQPGAAAAPAFPAAQTAPQPAAPPTAQPGTLPQLTPEQQAQVQQLLANPNMLDQFSNLAKNIPGFNQLESAVNSSMSTRQNPINRLNALTGNAPVTGDPEKDHDNKVNAELLKPENTAKSLALALPVTLGMDHLIEKGYTDRLGEWLDRKPLVHRFNQNIRRRMENGHGPLNRLYRNKRFKAFAGMLAPQAMKDMAHEDLLRDLRHRFRKLPPTQVEKVLNAFELKSLQDIAHLRASGAPLDDAAKFSAAQIKNIVREALDEPYRGKAGKIARSLHGARNFATGQLSRSNMYEQRIAHIGREFSLGRSLKNFAWNTRALLVGEGLNPASRAGVNAAQKSGFLDKLLPAALKSKKSVLIGAILSGMFVAGSGFAEAKHTEKGSKVRGFMHGLLGNGIATLIPFILAERLFRDAGLIHKALKGLGVKRFARMGSVAGFASSILAMFVLTGPFRKAGEAVSHVLFGKPQYAEDTVEKTPANQQLGTLSHRPGMFSQLAQQSTPVAASATPGADTPASPQSAGGPTPADMTGAMPPADVTGSSLLQNPGGLSPQQIAQNDISAQKAAQDQAFIQNIDAQVTKALNNVGLNNLPGAQMPGKGRHGKKDGKNATLAGAGFSTDNLLSGL